MAATVPLVNRSAGDLLTTTLWNTYVVANVNKLLNQGHRKLTVAQFAALTGIEDGDEVYLEVDAANGIEWHLVYRTAEATYKWRFLGGPPMIAEVATQESNGSNGAYVALTTAGPSIALPRAGDYDVDQGSQMNATAAGNIYHSYDIRGTGADDADAAICQVTAASQGGAHYRSKRKTALATGSLVSKYKGSVQSGFTNRSMIVTPVRLRHDA